MTLVATCCGCLTILCLRMQQPTDHSVKTAPVVTERRKRTRDEDDGEELYIQVKRRLLLSPNHAQIEDLGNDNHAPNSLFPSPSGSSTLPPTAICEFT